MGTQGRTAAILTFTFVVCLAMLLALPAAAFSPAGEAQRINAPSNYWQVEPAAAVAAGDGFLVLWEDMRHGIAGRFVTAAGAPVGGEITFVANSPYPDLGGRVAYVGNRQAVAAALPDGDFLLLWTRLTGELSYGFFQSDFRVEESSIYAQRFTAAGAAASEPVRLSDPATGPAERPALAVTAEGRAVAVWQQAMADEADHHVVGRLLDSSGGVAGAPFRATADPVPSPRPKVVADARHGFLVAWTGLDRDERGIFARRYTDDAVAAGDGVRVNQVEDDGQSGVSVAASADGGYLLAWQHSVGGGEYRTHGRFLNPAGRPTGDELPLSVEISQAESAATLAPLPNGGYYLFWLGWHHTKPQWVAGLELDAAGAPVGEPTRVSTERPRAQYRLGVAVQGDAALVVWEGWQDRGYGVEGRSFELPVAKATQVLSISTGQ